MLRVHPGYVDLPQSIVITIKTDPNSNGVYTTQEVEIPKDLLKRLLADLGYAPKTDKISNRSKSKE